MEITGCDSVVFTFADQHEVFALVLAAVVGRWPNALVEDLETPDGQPQPISDFKIQALTDEGGHLLFYRNADMIRHMDEEAYLPMSDGDGPFAILSRVRKAVDFAVAGLMEVKATDHQSSGTLPPEPYDAWLCSPTMVEFTAVTPDDPNDHPFSSWVLHILKAACRSKVD